MTHCKGLRRRTRSMFSQPFRYKGAIRIKNYLTVFKVGDYVDIKVDASQHKGMPFKFYHGRTGRVFNVNKRALGVVVNKLVNGRIIEKRIHVRTEHVKKSKCREDFLQRVKKNDAAKREAKAQGKTIDTKRAPVAPKEAELVKPSSITYQNSKLFKELF